MISFQRRLLILLTTILVVSFLLLGFFVHNSLSEAMMNSNRKELQKTAKEVNNLVSNHPDDRHSMMKNYDAITGNDYLVIDRNNKVTYMSPDITRKQFEKEINQFPAHEDSKVMYHHNSKSGLSLLKYNDKENYTVMILNKYTDLKVMKEKLWQYIGFLLLILLPIIYIIVRYINKSYIQPINEVTYASKLLADGNYKVRVPESSVTETKELYISTNILARTLQDLNNEQKLQTNRLETTLQNIPSAIMMVNKYGEVSIVNETYKQLFNMGKDIKRGHYDEVLEIIPVKRMIKEAIATEKPVNEDIKINVNVHKKYFDVAVVPVLSKNRKKLEGVVIVMHDITQLKTLEQMRKDFVANVSHELKTPITSIKGFTETLQDGAKNDPESLEMFLDIILKESNRIQVLVSELLELSKIEQANHFTMSRVNIAQKIFNSIEVVHQLAEKKDIRFEIDLEKEVYAMAEPSKLKQVYINLLSNAINYSPKGAVIKVNAYSRNKECVVEVIDEGIGIAPEEQIRIFERFYRVDRARSRDSGGTGLGLAIVKHIVEVFNGEIEVESEPGKGSTFRVILPQHFKY